MAIPASVFNNRWIMRIASLGKILMVLWSIKIFVSFLESLEIETTELKINTEFGLYNKEIIENLKEYLRNINF